MAQAVVACNVLNNEASYCAAMTKRLWESTTPHLSPTFTRYHPSPSVTEGTTSWYTAGSSALPSYSTSPTAPSRCTRRTPL